MGDSSLADEADFVNASRGFIASLAPGVVRAADGRVVWNNDEFSFLDGECPDTVNSSLWRQSQLCAKQGLFEVTEGIYQIRGLDLSNMTLVEGDHGVIVIDPLVSVETAAAALALYREHRGNRPVTGLIYTHSHVDHFGGVEGILEPENTNNVPIVAPFGFTRHAVSENVYAGTAMGRRGIYHTGALLPKNPTGMVGTGLGQTASTGRISFIPPNLDVTATGQAEVIDGVHIVFQLTPNTEAPAEMNFHFPDRQALCLAENATHNLHNILTLRGALVRDSRAWARYLDEAINLFINDTDVAFASHHWPIWGRESITTFLSEQRDLYAYLHDQTLRLLNQGYTGTEIAELIELSPALQRAWHAHGYYGSVNHNVKAIYQRYMGWFDGNPAHLWEHPPAEQSKRYIESMGGPDNVLALARNYLASRDMRFAATLLNHIVFTDPANSDAKFALAEVYERLGYGAENGTWRNFYLTGAMELREGIKPNPMDISGGMISALSAEEIFDSLAIRINGPRAWNDHFIIDVDVTDTDENFRLTLSNGALTHQRRTTNGYQKSDVMFTLTREQLLGLLAGKVPQGIATNGDITVVQRLIGVLDTPDPNFPIVTP